MAKKEVECPFSDPVPPGRKTKNVPPAIRQELADLERRRKEFNSRTVLRDPSRRAQGDDFATYYSRSSTISGELNRIEIDVLGRPRGMVARIAFHAGWRYSIETTEVLEKEKGKKATRRNSELEQLIEAFGAKRTSPWPFRKKAPAGTKTFDVPPEVVSVLVLGNEKERAAAKLIGTSDKCDDSGMWFRRHTLADAIEYFANDHLRTVYGIDDRHSVEYWLGFKCSFHITLKSKK